MIISFRFINYDIRNIQSHLGAAVVACLAILFLVGFPSCSKNENIEEEDVLIFFEDQTLLKKDVENRIPPGILPEDSLSLSFLIMENWLKTKVLENLAKTELLDFPLIESKVEEYKQHLIVRQYLERLHEKKQQIVDEDEIIEYYEQNKASYLNEEPLLKAVVVKLPSRITGSDRQNILGLLKSRKIEDIDSIENLADEKNVEIFYQADNWLPLSDIEGIVSSKIVTKQLVKGEIIEIKRDNETAFVRIDDYLKEGDPTPHEYARNNIVMILDNSRLINFEDSIVAALISKGISKNTIKINDNRFYRIEKK